jgi:uncharacterized membrane protein
LHNFFTSLRGGRAKQKLEAGSYNPWQKAKYYALVGFLVAALLGADVVGWLDPFSFFFRSLSTSIYPAINKVLVAVFTWIYDADPGVGPVRLTLATEPIYGFLRKYFLAAAQPYYWGSLLIGTLFIAVVALNFFRPRFWCRYVCPLGALLGVVGKNPLVRLKKNEEACNNCRLCLVDCQGGATPDTLWKPAECFYCWNCKSDCPAQAVTFTVGCHSEPAVAGEESPQLAQAGLHEPFLGSSEGLNCGDSSPARVRRAQNDSPLRRQDCRDSSPAKERRAQNDSPLRRQAGERTR